MLELAVWPALILKKKTESVVVFDKELEFLAEQMFETMYSLKGIGLAAPQVNLNKRMLVMDIDNNPLVVINPKISDLLGPCIKESEGCLSFPGFLVDVERPSHVFLDYQNFDGTWEKEVNFTGLESRCVQHEIDHLDGITFLRYISKQHRDLIDKKLRKKRGY